MKKITFLLASILTAGMSFSQLCTPQFANGCAVWNNQMIIVGDINWTFDGVDCTQYDYTSLSTALTKGLATPMSVTSGDWCGCSVWIDLNNDLTFDNTENLFYEGNGSTASNSFNFNITIPSNASDGNYIMRVIASWGSDGFNQGTNGYGACGSYQYGNFQDFTVSLAGGSNGLSSQIAEKKIEIYPNPTKNNTSISVSEEILGQKYSLYSSHGKLVLNGKISAEKIDIATEGLTQGVYFLSIENQKNTYKIVKQ